MKKNEQRFEVEEYKSQGLFGVQTYVLIDRETGVQYLYGAAGYGAGLTVLLGADGKPLLHPDYVHQL